MMGLLMLIKGKVRAENCPEVTTVNGENSITFVGGLLNLGGDEEANVWFEYGTSSGNYKFQTEKKLMKNTGKYCITVNNLEPCTIYYYRAVMENLAGISYGAEKSKKTLCSAKSLSGILNVKTLNSNKFSNGDNSNIKDFLLGNFVSFVFDKSLLIPLIFSLILVFLLKSHILRWENWLRKKNDDYYKFKVEKLLKEKISKIKSKT